MKITAGFYCRPSDDSVWEVVEDQEHGTVAYRLRDIVIRETTRSGKSIEGIRTADPAVLVSVLAGDLEPFTLPDCAPGKLDRVLAAVKS